MPKVYLREYFLCLKGPSNLTGQWKFTDTKDPERTGQISPCLPKGVWVKAREQQLDPLGAFLTQQIFI